MESVNSILDRRACCAQKYRNAGMSVVFLTTIVGQSSAVTPAVIAKTQKRSRSIEGSNDGNNHYWSGFNISPDGTIVTNLHVIRR